MRKNMFRLLLSKRGNGLTYNQSQTQTVQEKVTLKKACARYHVDGIAKCRDSLVISFFFSKSLDRMPDRISRHCLKVRDLSEGPELGQSE